ncbi:MAG: phosphocholine cytidylyltransferase/choline kinase family protein [Peptococcaceae bacterium]|nr:phosphocholine cytidylyltransferase/choline kinase family protein [Peptococcaceae bacterium]
MKAANFVEICKRLLEHPASTQRELAAATGLSLGLVNSTLKECLSLEYLRRTSGNELVLTETGQEYLDGFRVDNAIILAAGFGSRFVPFTYETPKGLLKVKGIPMIERQIEQLKACGINEIVIVVGYLKESFDYLIDKYGVKLVYNPEYAAKNNFASLYYALDHLKHTYLLVADTWIESNIFSTWETKSWYSCLYFEGQTAEWGVTANAQDRITQISIGGTDTWALFGPAFLSRSFSLAFAQRVRARYLTPGSEDDYWEHILRDNLDELPPIYINKQTSRNIYEFESLEDLRLYDESYSLDSGNAYLSVISEVFAIPQSGITAIRPLKEGMTNTSFIFRVADDDYVFRRPGAGTEELINRQNEKMNYELIAPLGISDEIIYFNGDSGIKISKYYAGARVSDPDNDDEVRTLMGLLKGIHDAGIKPEHRFDIEERINYYENLAAGLDAILFSDYKEIRAKADELLSFRKALAVPEVLCHIDYIYANVLHLPDGEIKVIDWEYSGAADPLIDIAMYAIYTYYSKKQMDLALRHYLQREPTRREEARLYMYVALGGFLWSLWAQYKQGLGDEFGEYTLTMYRYMKEYYQLLKNGGYLNEPSIGE